MLSQENLKVSALRRPFSCTITRGGLGTCSPEKIWNLALSECNFPVLWENFKPLRQINNINSSSPERHKSDKKYFLYFYFLLCNLTTFSSGMCCLDCYSCFGCLWEWKCYCCSMLTKVESQKFLSDWFGTIEKSDHHWQIFFIWYVRT